MQPLLRQHAEEPTPMPDPDKPFTHPKQKEQRDVRRPLDDAPGDDTPGEDPALWEGEVRRDC
jgi:hypothetical protein